MPGTKNVLSIDPSTYSKASTDVAKDLVGSKLEKILSLEQKRQAFAVSEKFLTDYYSIRETFASEVREHNPGVNVEDVIHLLSMHIAATNTKEYARSDLRLSSEGTIFYVNFDRYLTETGGIAIDRQFDKTITEDLLKATQVEKDKGIGTIVIQYLNWISEKSLAKYRKHPAGAVLPEVLQGSDLKLSHCIYSLDSLTSVEIPHLSAKSNGKLDSQPDASTMIRSIDPVQGEFSARDSYGEMFGNRETIKRSRFGNYFLMSYDTERKVNPFIAAGFSIPFYRLLIGPPGNGKSMIVKTKIEDLNRLSQEYHLPFQAYMLTGGDMKDMWVGNSEKIAKRQYKIFKDPGRRVYVAREEIEVDIPAQDQKNSSPVDSSLVNITLQFYGGALDTNNGSEYVDASTNYPWKLEKRMFDRFGYSIQYVEGTSTAEEKFNYLKALGKGRWGKTLKVSDQYLRMVAERLTKPLEDHSYTIDITDLSDRENKWAMASMDQYQVEDVVDEVGEKAFFSASTEQKIRLIEKYAKAVPEDMFFSFFTQRLTDVERLRRYVVEQRLKEEDNERRYVSEYRAKHQE